MANNDEAVLMAQPPPAQQVGWRPVPDPTTLTTEALQREIKSLGDLLRAEAIKEPEIARRISHVFDLIHAEMVGDRQATLVRFEAVGDKFVAVESQRKELKEDTEKNIQAALLAQKDAVKEQNTSNTTAINKTDVSVKEQLAQQKQTTDAQLAAVNEKIGGLTSRVDTIQALKLGASEVHQTTNQSTNLIVAVIVAAVVVVGFLLTLIDRVPVN